jgi:hypothetical protein
MGGRGSKVDRLKRPELSDNVVMNTMTQPPQKVKPRRPERVVWALVALVVAFAILSLIVA